jgi:hypothetical protein
MVHGHASLDILTIVIYILISVLVGFFGQKEGIFWEKNVFLVESSMFFGEN